MILQLLSLKCPWERHEFVSSSHQLQVKHQVRLASFCLEVSSRLKGKLNLKHGEFNSESTQLSFARTHSNSQLIRKNDLWRAMIADTQKGRWHLKVNRSRSCNRRVVFKFWCSLMCSLSQTILWKICESVSSLNQLSVK